MHILFTTIMTVLSLTGCIGAGQNSDVEAIAPAGPDCRLGSFPEVTGIDLEGNERRVPTDLSNGPRLVVAAYLREQQADVDTWYEKLPQIRERVPGVSFHELPVISKSSAGFRFWLNNGMRSGVPESRRRDVITVYTDVQKFLDATDQPDTSAVGVFLLDQNGCILARTRGRYSAESMATLLREIERTK